LKRLELRGRYDNDGRPVNRAPSARLSRNVLKGLSNRCYSLSKRVVTTHLLHCTSSDRSEFIQRERRQLSPFPKRTRDGTQAKNPRLCPWLVSQQIRNQLEGNERG
jgi:hypothetical protein